MDALLAVYPNAQEIHGLLVILRLVWMRMFGFGCQFNGVLYPLHDGRMDMVSVHFALRCISGLWVQLAVRAIHWEIALSGFKEVVVTFNLLIIIFFFFKQVPVEAPPPRTLMHLVSYGDFINKDCELRDIFAPASLLS